MKDQNFMVMQMASAISKSGLDPDQALDMVLELIRIKMKEKKITQVKIQADWNWKGTYVSQILNKSKRLTLYDFLKISHTLGIHPQAFFAEVYQPDAVGVDADHILRKLLE